MGMKFTFMNAVFYIILPSIALILIFTIICIWCKVCKSTDDNGGLQVYNTTSKVIRIEIEDTRRSDFKNIAPSSRPYIPHNNGIGIHHDTSSSVMRMESEQKQSTMSHYNETNNHQDLTNYPNSQDTTKEFSRMNTTH